jgi:hypothetical protein
MYTRVTDGLAAHTSPRMAKAQMGSDIPWKEKEALALPSEVDPQKVAAEFKNGVLNVHLPKSASAKPKAIEVKVS